MVDEVCLSLLDLLCSQILIKEARGFPRIAPLSILYHVSRLAVSHETDFDFLTICISFDHFRFFYFKFN